MSLLDIRVLGDPILRQETKVVAKVTDGLRQLIDEMFETMYAAKGIGLAAPQVGRTERVAVVDVDDNPLVIINPEIVAADGKPTKSEEGCLSIPEVYGDVERPEHVVVRALPAARDRSPARQALHRLPERPQKARSDEEVGEGEGEIPRRHSEAHRRRGRAAPP